MAGEAKLVRRKKEVLTEESRGDGSGGRSVEKWRECPICFGGLGGIGKLNGYHEAKSTQYLKCGKCGHSWSAVVKTVVESVDLKLT